MIRLCIFDLDGTLSNTLESIAFFGNQALKQLGYPTIDSLDTFRYLVGNGADSLMRGMLKTVAGSVSEEAVKKLRHVYDQAYEQAPMYLVKEYDGIRKLLDRLQQKRILLAVLSNKPDNMAKQVVAQLFGEISFARCYGQRPGVQRKPSPQGAQLIAQELEIPVKQCLYVGDTDVDMKTGKSAGMRTIGVRWGFREEEELRSHGADGVISHPLELLDYLD
ncbi:MAG: HAD family hydrolase [Clostridiales bacterium]|jgi:phosphoglycolate phosphatase|nr:HAD family hydrolase [Clostridiales bacterium]